jgi:hypothetical protein
MTLLRTVKYQIQVYKNNEDMRKKGNTLKFILIIPTNMILVIYYQISIYEIF